MEQKTSSTKALILGIIAGGTIGSILALLFAPKSGRKLRKDIRKKSRKVVKETRLYVDSVQNRVS